MSRPVNPVAGVLACCVTMFVMVAWHDAKQAERIDPPRPVSAVVAHESAITRAAKVDRAVIAQCKAAGLEHDSRTCRQLRREARDLLTHAAVRE